MRFASVFAVILTFSRLYEFAAVVIRKLLLYPPELRGRPTEGGADCAAHELDHPKF